MNSFIVTYDLKKRYANDRSDSYNNLYKKLETYFNYAKVSESSWIIQGDYTCVFLRDDIASILLEDDTLFVGKLTGEAAWKKCIDPNEKIKNTL